MSNPLATASLISVSASTIDPGEGSGKSVLCAFSLGICSQLLRRNQTEVDQPERERLNTHSISSRKPTKIIFVLEVNLLSFEVPYQHILRHQQLCCKPVRL